MKTIVFIFSFLIIATMIGYAQHVSEQDVPLLVKQALTSKYPGITVKKWTKEKDVYEAEVILNTVECEVAFDTTGKWLETEHEIENTELPKTVLDAIASSDYKSWKMKEAEAIESPAYTKAYEVELKKDKEKVALLYSPEGMLLKTEKD